VSSPSGSGVLLREADGGVVTLTLNRPESYNALDTTLRDALLDAIRGAEVDGERCIVLRGAGRGFCAGIDLKGGAGNATGYDVMNYMRTSTQAIVRTVLASPVPIVTAVHGVCAGVALVLALGADHCVASTDARLSAPFVARSLVPDGASIYLLPRLVGTARARRMLLFGEDVGAPEAFAAGMIGEVVDPVDLDATARDRAARLAALPVAAIQFTRSMLLRSFELDLESALFEERAGQALMSTTADFAEGRAAFLERRPPRFGEGERPVQDP
jgi:2-(1,2-epoxy-1,2-dihydrophenyl)acetyl-CoA isomerase